MENMEANESLNMANIDKALIGFYSLIYSSFIYKGSIGFEWIESNFTNKSSSSLSVIMAMFELWGLTLPHKRWNNRHRPNRGSSTFDKRTET